MYVEIDVVLLGLDPHHPLLPIGSRTRERCLAAVIQCVVVDVVSFG